MKKLVFALITLCAVSNAFGADEMKKLDFMVGEWSGEAWVQMGPGKRETVLQTEVVRPKLGGKVLVIDGLGKSKKEDGSIGDIVHEALGVVSWDEKKKTYRFSAYTVKQGDVDTTLDLRDDGSAVWGFDVPGGKVRYTIRLTEKGEWHEVGDFSRDGSSWVKFFEMTLQKTK